MIVVHHLVAGWTHPHKHGNCTKYRSYIGSCPWMSHRR